jgi:hypothetical protein
MRRILGFKHFRVRPRAARPVFRPARIRAMEQRLATPDFFENFI